MAWKSSKRRAGNQGIGRSCIILGETMKRSFIIFFAFIITFALAACESQKKDENDLAKDSTDTKMDSASFAPAIQKPDPSITLISPETLELLLPTNIIGAEKYPSSKGRQNYGDKSWTSASSEYSFGKGMLVIQINDYGTSGNMPEDEYRVFTFLPEMDGMKSDRVWYKNGKGYTMINQENGDGKLQVLYENRFVVNIDGYQLDENDPGLIYYLKKINVDKFKELSK